MQNSIKVLALVALAFGAFSCAQESTVSQNVLEDRIVDAYVKQHPEWQGKKTESGLYIIKTDAVASGTTPTLTDWVELKFTGETLDGNYFQTTDTAVVNKLEYSLNFFHIVPDFLFMSGAMPQGIREALLTMKEGEKVKILMPSYVGFGSYGAIKFGQMALLPNVSVLPNYPVKFNLELVKVVSKPLVTDSLKVDSYVKANPGFVDIKDKKIYLKELVKGSTALEDTIGKGTKIGVFYAGYFLDEMIYKAGNLFFNSNQRPYCFDTNIEEVGKSFYPYLVNYGLSGGVLQKSDTLNLEIKDDGSVVAAASGSPMTEGFGLAIKKMTKNSEVNVVMTSKYVYGVQGRSSTDHKPSIAPYAPLRFYIKVVKVTNTKKTTT